MRRSSLVLFTLFLCCCWAVLAFAQEKWNEHRSAHFAVIHKNIPRDFVNTVEQTAEGYYRDITKNLGFHREHGWMSDERMKIYIYQDAKDYAENGRQYEWSHGAASVAERTIRTFPSAAGFFDSTLPHEMGHIIFREFIGLQPEVPLWFEEGVAMYQEKAKRYGANTVIKEAIKNGQFIPLTELTNMRLYSGSSKEKLEMFYAESASIVYYMIGELGEYNFVRLCRGLRDGKPFPEALKNAYARFRTLEDLNRGWMNYLEQLK